MGSGWRESAWEKLREGKEGGSDAIVFYFKMFLKVAKKIFKVSLLADLRTGNNYKSRSLNLTCHNPRVRKSSRGQHWRVGRPDSDKPKITCARHLGTGSRYRKAVLPSVAKRKPQSLKITLAFNSLNLRSVAKSTHIASSLPPTAVESQHSESPHNT